MVGSQRTADVFPVVASLREVTPGNMSAVGRLYVGGKIMTGFQMLSKFSLVYSSIQLNTTAGSRVVNHASTVNVFSCQNSQFELPQNLTS